MTRPEKPVRILVVEDNPEDFQILQVHFSKIKHRRYEVENASSLSKGLDELRRNSHEVYLVDYQLGPDSGMDFLKEAVAARCTAPIILLTGYGNHDLDMKAMALGAADFLNKNKLDADLLERSIRYALEHKRSEEALRREEEFFRALIENALDGVALIESDGKTRYVSPSIEGILGYNQQERMGQDFFSLIHPDDLHLARDLFTQALSSPGRVFKAEFRTKHKDGSWRLIEATGKSHELRSPDFKGVVLNYRDISLQKKAEEGIRRLAAIVESSEDAVFSVSLDQVVLSWNPAAQRIYGFTPEEIGGRSVDLIIPPDRRDELTEIFETIRQGKAVSNVLTQHRDKKGRAVSITMTVSPLRDPSNQITRASVIARDITESEKVKAVRNMLQDERDQLLDRLQLQMERMPIAYVLTDQNNHFTYWNPAAEKMFGYSFREVEGKMAKDMIILPADFPSLEAHQQRFKDGDMTFQGKVSEHRRKDDKTIVCEWYVTPMRDPEGTLLGNMGMALDITERRKAEEVQSQLAAILQQTTDAVFGSDLEGRIFSWNRGAETMLGYRLEEIVGENTSLLVPMDRKEEMEKVRELATREENVSNYETVMLKKNGELLEVSVTVSPIKDTKGKIVGVSAISRDITERKQAEESLKKHEEQMRLAQKMEAIGRLAGGVAHDFNNLLSVIGGNADFLLSGLEKKNVHREEVEEIQKAVKRGAELTRQLLVFGQKQVVQPQPIDLNELGDEMSKMLKRLIDASIRLSIIKDKKLKPILADPGQMQQVILNLVLNARDAMPNGGQLILETHQVEEEKLALEERSTLPAGSYVRLSVTDTGIGMTPEIQKHIFEPFFTTKAGKGTGLGLATVYGIVTKWNGHIFLHSNPGMGTTFTFYFPAMVSVEGFEAKPKQIALIPNGSETLLVAEDEEPVRKVMVRSLEKYGYRVLEAQNGIEAVQKAWGYQETIHLLLTDTVMPKMNGKELADELKKTRPRMKVLFVSGYPKEILSQQGILSANIHLLQKPFDLENLAREIRKVLDEKG